MMFPSVTVVMSTYNGATVVVRQLDSIINQKGVRVSVVVRDDGSKDDTLQILLDYSKAHPEVTVLQGENVGWERSFLYCLQQTPVSDYYAFSDQDDLWFDDKLISGVEQIIRTGLSSPVLYHCNKISVWENLEPLRKQVSRIPRPLNRQNAMIQEYVQGCSVIMNYPAKELVCRYSPKEKIAHDFWCGLICFLFGSVIYDDGKYFYHINYGTNASGEGHKWKSRLGRIKKYRTAKHFYYRPYQDLLDGYSMMLLDRDILFIKNVLRYKQSLKVKLSLLLSRKFVRASFVGTVALKIAILFNKL